MKNFNILSIVFIKLHIYKFVICLLYFDLKYIKLGLGIVPNPQ